MNYFQGRRAKSNWLEKLIGLKPMLLAVKLAFQRTSHLIRGRKRLHASSLAYKTTLALVPALAVLMAVLADNSFSKPREQILNKIVDGIYPVEAGSYGPWPGSSEAVNLQKLNEVGKRQIKLSVEKFAKHARAVGWMGLGAFVLVLFLLLRDVEGAFNFLWGVEKSRSFLAQVFIYMGLLIGAPVLLAIGLAGLGWVGQWVSFKPGWFLSFLGPWIVCAGIYKWFPNVKVRWKPALWGGFLAALLLEGGRWGLGWYVFHVVGSSRIYGVIWTIPVILLWFYLFWTILLFGTEVAYFTQKGRDDFARSS